MPKYKFDAFRVVSLCLFFFFFPFPFLLITTSVITCQTYCGFRQSYGRAIELDDTNVFALVESGNIFLMLGSFKKVRFLCGDYLRSCSS